jgi:two-component system sensor histidine kinase KdpD
MAPRLSRTPTRYAVTLAIVGAITLVIAGIRQGADVSNASMVYLLAVLASAVLFGRGPAIAAAVASFLAFNFFFVEPRYQFTVSDNDEWVALGLLLVSGVITAQLATLLRERARESERREEEAVVLYDVVRWMSDPGLERALTGVAERLRAELGLAAVTVVLGGDVNVRVQADAGDTEAIRLASETAGLPEMVLGPAPGLSSEQRAGSGRWIRVVPPVSRGGRVRDRRISTVPVSANGRQVGSIILVRRLDEANLDATDDRLLTAVAQQIGQALERLELRRQATEAEVLRRTDELRTALVNAVSHDLRTPLSSIIASAGSLRQTDVEWSEAEEREFVDSILTEAERLNRLVGNLLDLSRIESGSLQPDKGWYDLSSLATDVVNRISRDATDHTIRLEAPDEMPPLLFDYVEVDQVISNLLENAIKHTPEGTEITVSVRPQPSDVLVSVEDSGPGMPEQDLPQIFKPFYRGQNGAGAKGSGLGLAIARGIVEAHGGRIWAENRREGGARFVFSLPIEERPAAAA